MKRLLAVATAFVLATFGLVVPNTAQAASTYTVSGTISFPPSAPSSVRKAAPDAWEDNTSGVRLFLHEDKSGPITCCDLARDSNVSYNASTGAWSVSGLRNGTYRLSINVSLPKNGSARGTSQTVVVNGKNVSVGTTKIKEQAYLASSFGRCETSSSGSWDRVAENLATGKKYLLTAGQRGYMAPAPLCGSGATASFGYWDLFDAPAGNYVLYAEQGSIREYYTGAETGSRSRSKAKTLSLKYWEGNQTEYLLGFAKPLAATSPKAEISGTPKVGETLKASASGWTSGAALSYQWRRNGKAIDGATKSSYKVTASDLTTTLSVSIKGSKSGHESITKTSASTKTVAKGTLTTAKPKISGTAKVGKKLTASPGTWTGGTSFSYRWYRDGKKISGATKSTYKLTKSDAGKKVTVKVKGSKSGYTSVTRTSSKTAKIKK